MRHESEESLPHRLLLLRHAKAGWAPPGMQDFDRPLTASGRAAAAALGTRMQAEGFLPDIVLCSSAQRARETWENVASRLTAPTPDLTFEEKLYSSDARGYLDIIHEARPCTTLLLVGHNPMMEDLAFALPSDGERYAMRQAGAGFPPCGLAVLHFAASLATITPGTGHLHAFVQPERL